MHFSEQANSQMESSDENELYLLSKNLKCTKGIEINS